MKNQSSSGEAFQNVESGRDSLLQQVVSAANKTLRTKADSELVDQGIDLMFDAGIVATCRHCRLSWRVSRSRFKELEWWSCPGNCKGQASRQ
jgi:hypothetical protein